MNGEMATHWWACEVFMYARWLRPKLHPFLKVTLALIESADSVNVVNVMSGSFYEYFLIYHFMISAETFIIFLTQNEEIEHPP